MKQRFFSILALLLMAASWQSVCAANIFSVTRTTSGTTTTFTITRSNGDTSIAETVYYRTVSLSALDGQNFTGVSGTLTFNAGETTKTVNVTEQTATDMFKYAAGYSSWNRSYRFEVLDANGFLLADLDRNIGVTRVQTQALSDIYDLGNTRDGIMSTTTLTITDQGYAKNSVTVTSGSFYDSNTQSYLVANGTQLRMTLDFEAKEKNDGYQHIQILTDNTSTNDTGAKDGDPGTISLSRYMACFEIKKGSKYDTEYKKFTFPVLTVGNNEGHTNPWGYGTDFPLSKQKFNTNCRATDGKLILNTDFNTIVLRFTGSGDYEDDWYVKNINAHVTAVDVTPPTVQNDNITVSPGPYNKGNDFYISVPFSEIVLGASTTKLYTSWGEATYISGSGSNVLTFKGTITADAGTTLSVTGNDGARPCDLFQNYYYSSISKTLTSIVSTDPQYTIDYDLGGGSFASAYPSSYRWSTADFTLTNPTRSGYTFAGWTGSNGATPETAVTITSHSHGHLAYTANWIKNSYTLSEGTSVGVDALAGLVAAWQGQQVEVSLTRAFSADVSSTICLPFPMTSITGGSVYELRDVSYDNENAVWVATMNDVTPNQNLVTSTTAGKPYLFMPSATGNVTFTGIVSTVPATTDGFTLTDADGNDGWTMKGTYTKFAWNADDYGTIFGFASKDKTVDGVAVKAGEFVRAKDGAKVPAFRAYLTYTGDSPALKSRAMTRAVASDALPESIIVCLIGKGGDVTAVGSLDTRTGEFTTNGWYDMSGRRLGGKPTVKGVYINNGKKVIIQ